MLRGGSGCVRRVAFWSVDSTAIGRCERRWLGLWEPGRKVCSVPLAWWGLEKDGGVKGPSVGSLAGMP